MRRLTKFTYSNKLKMECFKYIDGCRAQQVLQFETAAELAEEARTEAE